MIVCGIILVLLIILWLKFRNYKKDAFEKLPQKGNELKKLYPLAYGILTVLKRRPLTILNQGRRKKLESLNVVKEEKETELLFNIRRLSYSIAVIAATSALAFLYSISREDMRQIQEYRVKRPAYAENAKQLSFFANGAELIVEIHPREFSMEELQENFQEAYEVVLQRMRGENTSLGQVCSNLNLVSYLEEYAMKITWMSSNPLIVDTFGTVYNEDFLEEQKETVILTAVFSYLETECRYEITVEVTAPILTKEERFLHMLKRVIRENDEMTRTEESVVFPEELEGEKIRYEESGEDHTMLLLLLGILTAIIIVPAMDKELDKRMKVRKQEMLLDYSEIVSKLNILSGAGMSILKAWEKIVKDYEKKTDRNFGMRRFAYEEMRITYYEIQSGISEGSAYAAFGRRCNIHEYLKLGTLLEQNVKKGAKGLSKMLEEAVNAFEQRKNIAKKLGEEAGTKLLIPMIIMLAIVMLIVLIPAFTSFNV